MVISCFEAASPLLWAQQPATILQKDDTIQIVDTGRRAVLWSCTLKGVRIRSFSDGSLVVLAAGRSPVLIHINRRDYWSLEAISFALDILVSKPDRDVKDIAKKLVLIRKEDRRWVAAKTVSSLQVVAESDEFVCLERSESFDALESIWGSRDGSSSVHDITSELSRLVSVQNFFTSSINEMDDEVVRWIDSETKLRYVSKLIAKFGIAYNTGCLRHVSSGLTFAKDTADFKFLLSNPEEELARFGRESVPNDVSIQSQLVSTLALDFAQVEPAMEGTDLEMLAVSCEGTFFAIPTRLGLNVFACRRDSYPEQRMEHVAYALPKETSFNDIALSSTLKHTELLPSEEELSWEWRSHQGGHLFPGLEAVISGQLVDGVVAGILAINESGTCSVLMNSAEEGREMQLECPLNDLQASNIQDGDIVFAIPVHPDASSFGRIGRILSSVSNGDSVTFLIQFGAMAKDSEAMKQLPKRTFSPPHKGWSLHEYNCSLPVWYPASSVRKLASSTTKRFIEESTRFQEIGKAAFFSVAVAASEGLFTYDRRLNKFSGEWEVVRSQLVDERCNGVARVAFLGANHIVVVTQNNDTYAIMRQSEAIDLSTCSKIAHVGANFEMLNLGASVVFCDRVSNEILLLTEEGDVAKVTLRAKLAPDEVPLQMLNMSKTVMLINTKTLETRLADFPSDDETASSPTLDAFDVQHVLQFLTWAPIRFGVKKVNVDTDWIESTLFHETVSRDDGVFVRQVVLSEPGVYLFEPTILDRNQPRFVLTQLEVLPSDYVRRLRVFDEVAGGELEVVNGKYVCVEGLSMMRIELPATENLAPVTFRVLGRGEVQESRNNSIVSLLKGPDLTSWLISECTSEFSAANAIMLLAVMSERKWRENEWSEALLERKTLVRFLEINFLTGLSSHGDALIFLLRTVERSPSNVRELVFDAALECILSDFVLSASAANGLCHLLTLVRECWPTFSRDAVAREIKSKILARLVLLGKQLGYMETSEARTLRVVLGSTWDVFEDPLPVGFDFHDERFIQIKPPALPASAQGSVQQQSGGELPSLAGVASLMKDVDDLELEDYPLSTLILKKQLGQERETSSGKSASPELLFQRSIGRLLSGESAGKLTDLKVHSSTAGTTTQFESENGSVVSAEVIFNDVLSRQSVVVWDLGEVRRLSGAQIQVIQMDMSEQLHPTNVTTLVASVETYVSNPPYASERISYAGRSHDGIPFDIEMHAHSGAFSFDKKDGTIGVRSTFPTVAPRGVSIKNGKWFYEATLVKTGEWVAQIGWCDSLFTGDDKQETGTGDDEHSWAFDGRRVKKWNSGSSSWGKKWKDGDILGCAIDVDEGKVYFGLNGLWKKPMGLAFNNIAVVGGVFPAFTAEKSFKCRMNFGQSPFKFGPPKAFFRSVFDWVIENRELAEDQPRSCTLFRRMVNEPSKAFEFVTDEPILARYLRVSYSYKDFVLSGGSLPSDVDYEEKSRGDISSRPRPLLKPRLQGKIKVMLKGSVSSLWPILAIKHMLSPLSAEKLLSDQARALELDRAKTSNQIANYRKSLAQVLNRVHDINTLAGKSSHWRADDLFAILQTMENGVLLPAEIATLPIRHQAASQALAVRNSLGRSLRHLVEIDQKLDAIRIALGQMDALVERDRAKSKDATILLCIGLCSLLLESDSGVYLSTPSVESLLLLYENLVVHSLSLDTKRAGDLVRYLIELGDEAYQVDLVMRTTQIPSAQTLPLKPIINALHSTTIPILLKSLIDFGDLDRVVRILRIRTAMEGKVTARDVEAVAPQVEVFAMAVASFKTTSQHHDVQLIFSALFLLRYFAKAKVEAFLVSLFESEGFLSLLYGCATRLDLRDVLRIGLYSLLDLTPVQCPPNQAAHPNYSNLVSTVRKVALEMAVHDSLLGVELMLWECCATPSESVLTPAEFSLLKRVVESSIESEVLCIATRIICIRAAPSDTDLADVSSTLMRKCLFPAQASAKDDVSTAALASGVLQLINKNGSILKPIMLNVVVEAISARSRVPVCMVLALEFLSVCTTANATFGDIEPEVSLRLLDEATGALQGSAPSPTFHQTILTAAVRLVTNDVRALRQVSRPVCDRLVQFLTFINHPSLSNIEMRHMFATISTLFVKGVQLPEFASTLPFVDSLMEVYLGTTVVEEPEVIAQILRRVIHHSEAAGVLVSRQIVEAMVRPYSNVDRSGRETHAKFEVVNIGCAAPVTTQVTSNSLALPLFFEMVGPATSDGDFPKLTVTCRVLNEDPFCPMSGTLELILPSWPPFRIASCAVEYGHFDGNYFVVSVITPGESGDVTAGSNSKSSLAPATSNIALKWSLERAPQPVRFVRLIFSLVKVPKAQDKITWMLPSSDIFLTQGDLVKVAKTGEQGVIVDVGVDVASVKLTTSQVIDVFDCADIQLVSSKQVTYGSQSPDDGQADLPSSTGGTSWTLGFTIQSLIIKGIPMRSPSLALGFPSRPVFELLLFTIELWPNAVNSLIDERSLPYVRTIFERLAEGQIPRAGKALIMKICPKSPDLTSIVLDRLLTEKDYTLSPVIQPSKLALAVALCCTRSASKDLHVARLVQYIRDRLAEKRDCVPAHLVQAWTIILVELSMLNGTSDLLYTLVGDVDVRLALELESAVRRETVSEQKVLQLIHIMAKVNHTACTFIESHVESLITQWMRGEHSANEHRESLSHRFVVLATSTPRCLELVIVALKSRFRTSGNETVPQQVLSALSHLAVVSKRVRTLIRTEGWLQTILTSASIGKNNGNGIDGNGLAVALRMITAAANREPDTQDIVAAELAEHMTLSFGTMNPEIGNLKSAIRANDDVTVAVLRDNAWTREDEGRRLSDFASELLQRAATFDNHVTFSVWNLSAQIDSLAYIELQYMLPTKPSGPLEGEVFMGDVVPPLTLAGAGGTPGPQLPFRLNPNACGKTIEISPGGASATQVAIEKWGVVRADRELPVSGTSWWEVKLEHCPKGHIFLGVGTSRSNIDGYLGCDRYGWGFIGNRGVWHNKHKENTYGKEFRSGDVVKVVVNATEGTLSFHLNGEDLGVAFWGLANLKLFPAFSLYQKGDKFTIINSSLPRVDGASSTTSKVEMSQMGTTSVVAGFLTDSKTNLLYTGSGSEVSLGDPLSYVAPGPFSYVTPGHLLNVRCSVPAHTVLRCIGKGALLGSLRAKYGREELGRLERSASAGFSIELPAVTDKALEDTASVGSLASMVVDDLDIIDVVVSATL